MSRGMSWTGAAVLLAAAPVQLIPRDMTVLPVS